MTYDYGDEVIFKTIDAAGHVIARPCAVVGITPVNNEALVRIHGHSLGTILYSVEFADGTDSLIPENELERLS